MTIKVYPDTFKSTGLHTYGVYTREEFSVEVSIGNDRRAVRCAKYAEDHLDLFDLAVRFSTGAKVWPGSATYWFKSGNVNNLRPNIDKRGHFICCGFFEDFAAAPVRSLHNAVA